MITAANLRYRGRKLQELPENNDQPGLKTNMITVCCDRGALWHFQDGVLWACEVHQLYMRLGPDGLVDMSERGRC